MQLIQVDPNLQALQPSPLLPTRREVAARIFRQSRTLLVVFGLVVVGFILTGQFKPKYRAEMRIMVSRDRVDPVVTTDASSTPDLQNLAVREEDVNSAVQLLRADDLMRDVAVKSGLIAADDHSAAAGKIVRKLSHDIDVSPITKTYLIAAVYSSPSPEQSRQVLANLASLFLERQRTIGNRGYQVQFYEAQANQHQRALQDAEAKLLAFTQKTGVVSADLERDLTVRRMEDLNSARLENQAKIADARARGEQIAAQMLTQPRRIATDQKESDNPQLLNQLKGTLLTLQLKRTELLNKYDPNYRLVKDLDREIVTAQAALDAQQNAPVREGTSTVNPTFMALQQELVNARSELSGLQAKSVELNQSSAAVKGSAEDLTGKGVDQEALLRTVATEKQQYQIYVDKLEQARVMLALDKNGILNLAVVQEPAAASLPTNSLATVGFAAIFAATLLGLGAAFLADLFDPTIRNSNELIEVLSIPTLAEFSPIHHLERSTL